MRFRHLSPLLLSLLALGAPAVAAEVPDSEPTEVMLRMLLDAEEQPPDAPQHLTPCENGMAGGYPCDNVDLLEFVPKSGLGNPSGLNDIWGWTDGGSGREFALVGTTTGTSFVEITDPEAPVYLGRLPTHTSSSTWRDIKTYANHAFIVSEASGHGMQVFDLTQLLSVATPPQTFTETAHYPGFGNAHNIVINEDTGYAYAVGTGTCSGGLHMVDIQTPATPTGAGCFSADGYTHDAQCVVYTGPDADHQGNEVCFNSNEDTVTIVDVTNKANPVQISRTPYPASGYTHQNWLTEDQEHLLVDDELDEQSFGHNTYTYVWDVRDLDAPQLLGHFASPTPAIDHNQYVVGDYSFQANYRSGLRILHLGDLDAPGGPEIQQVAFFDVYPTSDSANFNGAWSVYPYFPSGVVVVSHIEQGLFVLQPRLCTQPDAPLGFDATPNGDNRIDLSWTGSGAPGATYVVERALGGCGGTFEPIATGVTTTSYADTSASGQVTYGYRVLEQDATGLCTSVPSACVETSTTGACTAPPIFAGLASAATPATPWCAVHLDWSAGSPSCGGPVRYEVFRANDPAFLPMPANRIATDVFATHFDDFSAPPGVLSFYVVRAVDLGSGAADGNLVRRETAAFGPIADGTFATGAEIGDPPLDTSGDLNRGGAPEAPEHVGWHFSEARQNSGLRSFFSTSSNTLCVSLVAGPLELTAGETSELGFSTVFDIESGWDGGVVQIRPAGAPSWTNLGLTPNYPGAFNNSNSADACGFPNGMASFTGTDLTWGGHTSSLAAWSGQQVEIRWIYSTDGSQLGEGWYVDDISITHAQVPSACVPGAGIFVDDFEDGDATAWSAGEGILP